MQLFQSLAAAALLLASAVTAIDFATLDAAAVEPKEIPVTTALTTVVVTAIADQRNFANQYTKPICVKDVTRVREAIVNTTRTFHFEVNGCSMPKPSGLCDAAGKCKTLPFEVNLVGPATTPTVDTESATQRGSAVKSPYMVRSIGLLL